MERVKISEIVVEDRQRKEVTDIDRLANSIGNPKFGLLHPIIIDRKTLALVAGFRRLEACKLLKWEEIPVTFRDELSLEERKEIELEENLQRVDLSFVEEVMAKKELNEIKKRLYGSAIYNPEEGWGIADTAQALSESESLVKKDIALATAMEVMPELKKAKNKSEAFKMLRQQRDQLIRHKKIVNIEKENEGIPKEEYIKVVEGDCLEYIKGMENESVDLVIADPPFGIDLDSLSGTWKKSVILEKYKDEKEDVFILIKKMIVEVERVMKKDTHFYLFYPSLWYREWWDMLEEKFDYVDPIPIIWHKTNRFGTPYASGRPTRYMMQYQPILYIKKGDRALSSYKSNVLQFGIPTGNREHPAAMPSELMEVLIEQSSLPGELVFDPFSGSGPVPVACKKLGRRCVAIEQKHEYIEMIKEKLYEA